jgi:hypothetical protein
VLGLLQSHDVISSGFDGRNASLTASWTAIYLPTKHEK